MVAAAASRLAACAASVAALRSLCPSASSSPCGFPSFSSWLCASAISFWVCSYFALSAVLTAFSSCSSPAMLDFAACASFRNSQDAVSAIGHLLAIRSCAFFCAVSSCALRFPIRTRLSARKACVSAFNSEMRRVQSACAASLGVRACRSARTASISRTAASISSLRFSVAACPCLAV